ncbi:MAG TPA: hypothetical protein VHA73_10055, partial [Acidimicrobiales bacterium]|nr:hypothetical protein [Acidimicrobiales bacterium]
TRRQPRPTDFEGISGLSLVAPNEMPDYHRLQKDEVWTLLGAGISRMSRADRRAQRGDQMSYPLGTRARTGEVCPVSGVWKSLDTPSTTAPIAKGNRMPPHNSVAVTWELTRFA